MAELIVIVSAAAAAVVLWLGWRRALLQAHRPAPMQAAQMRARPGAAPWRANERPAQGESYQWPALGRFEFPVAATGRYQPALRSLHALHGEWCRAQLHTSDRVGEPVEVRVQGARVGYLHDGDATRFQRRLAYECRPGAPSQCAARIVASAPGGRREERALYTLVLDLKPFRH